MEDASANGSVPSVVIGSGINLPEADPALDFRKKHGLERPFVLYVGRVDRNKGALTLFAYFKKFLEEMVARDRYYMHNDPDHSDCDRMNADSHLRAMLLGHSLTLQISGGEVVLGQWQRILMAELDGPRARTLRAQVVGIA